jgi:uncharacterized protein YdhG (YjbR/CyaY superfamily)
MSDTFTTEERAAIKERAKELREQPKRGKAKADPEGEQLAKIAELAEPDRVIAERLHALVKEHAPTLTPKLWYGMPGWARDGKILCFFQPAAKFKTRYGTLGFNDNASLDDGTLWPVAYALAELTTANEKKLVELLRRAAG